MSVIFPALQKIKETCGIWQMLSVLLVYTMIVIVITVPLQTVYHVRRSIVMTTINRTSNITIQPLSGLPSQGDPCPVNSVTRAENVTLRMTYNMSLDNFLGAYNSYCCRVYHPRDKTLPPCPCLPYTLTGEMNLTEINILRTALKRDYLKPGGSWRPRDCSARHRVAIIIPYRDREGHLEILLAHLHTILQRQHLDYTIIVVEQSEPKIFNKAALMNVGYREARRLGDHDCYVFHDVDVLIENDRNMYTCLHQPRHMAPFLDKHGYKLPYRNLFGAITAFTSKQFQKVNGFSNVFYGWGGEDDDMAWRIGYHKMKIIRFPLCVARASMIRHKRDQFNPRNRKRVKLLKRNMFIDRIKSQHGLKSVNYTLIASTLERDHTRLLVDLPQA